MSVVAAPAAAPADSEQYQPRPSSLAVQEEPPSPQEDRRFDLLTSVEHEQEQPPSQVAAQPQQPPLSPREDRRFGPESAGGEHGCSRGEDAAEVRPTNELPVHGPPTQPPLSLRQDRRFFPESSRGDHGCTRGEDAAEERPPYEFPVHDPRFLLRADSSPSVLSCWRAGRAAARLHAARQDSVQYANVSHSSSVWASSQAGRFGDKLVGEARLLFDARRLARSAVVPHLGRNGATPI